MKKGKMKIKKFNLFILLLIIFVVSLFSFIIIFGRKNTIENKYSNKIKGEWTTDGVTVYNFNDDNTGEMILPLSKYKFDYVIKKDTLFIDFVNKKSEDIKYTYSFEDNKLILESNNGKFVFKRK